MYVYLRDEGSQPYIVDNFGEPLLETSCLAITQILIQDQGHKRLHGKIQIHFLFSLVTVFLVNNDVCTYLEWSNWQTLTLNIYIYQSWNDQTANYTVHLKR